MPLFTVDTTIFSNFAHSGRPQLLQLMLGSRAVTTDKVMAELQRGEEHGFVPHCDWGWVELALLSPAEAALSEEFARVVHAPESDCLALAVSRRAVFLSDDIAARRLALSRGVVVSGTLGVLRGLVQRGSIALPEADQLLASMVEHGYRSPVRSLLELTSS